MRALVAQLKLILVVGGLGRPHESTKPRRVRAREGEEFIAEFLAGESRVVLETMHPRVESR